MAEDSHQSGSDARGGEPTRRRVFLFLQGPLSPFFQELARRLIARGHAVRRVHICCGDRLFWRGLPAEPYRGTLDDWPAWIAAYMRREGVTDLVQLGHRRPHHLLACDQARLVGVKVFTIELGYLRPDWITLERNGMSAFSHFPTDPQRIREIAARVPEPDLKPRYHTDFKRQACWDVAYNLTNVLLAPFYPHYRWHAIHHPLADYAGWIAQLALRPLQKRRRQAMLRSVYATSAPCYLFPLQLATDYQIRANSGFPDQFAAIALTIRSFAAYAPAESLLLFKAHPLDNGLMRWERFIRRTASEGGVATRVHYLVGGKLNRLIDRCRGMVTINSTAGTTALQRAIPVIALGSAIFDIPGLTFQHGIDRFWSEAAPPDPAFVADFIRALAGSIQVKGGFYSHDAVQAGAEACAERLHLDLVNEPLAFEAQPPRMVALAARAQAQRLPARPHSAQRPRRRAIG